MNLPSASIDLLLYDSGELLALKRRIEDILPSEDLEDVDLTKELLLNYRAAQATLDKSKDSPLNQRAQVTNTLTSILKQLATLQKEHFSAARLQRFEKVASEVFQQNPDLYKLYKERLKA